MRQTIYFYLQDPSFWTDELFALSGTFNSTFSLMTVKNWSSYGGIMTVAVRKLSFLSCRKLPFLGRKLPLIVIKLPFIFDSYRYGFLLKINGNSGTDKVSVYRYKVTVFCRKVTVVMKVNVCPGTKLPFCSKVTVYIETYRYIKKLPFVHKVTIFHEISVFMTRYQNADPYQSPR